MHRSRLGNIVIDCRTDDLLAEAGFWSAALGYPIQRGADAASDFIQLVTPDDEVRVIIQRVSHEARAHLDIETDSIESEVARLETLGAQVVSRKDRWVVMQAPTGHRFCVGSPYRGGFEREANRWANIYTERTAMNNTELTHAPVAKTGMLIRRPVEKVFAAFIEPAVTTQFWFTKSSGRLEAGKQVKWEWEMYGASTQVDVKVIEPNRRIVIEWDGYSGRTAVEWKFAAQDGGTTFVSITESGWTGSGDELAEYACNSTEGFTWTLAGLKGLLEHNIRLNFVADRFPKGPQNPYPDQ